MQPEWFVVWLSGLMVGAEMYPWHDYTVRHLATCNTLLYKYGNYPPVRHARRA